MNLRILVGLLAIAVMGLSGLAIHQSWQLQTITAQAQRAGDLPLADGPPPQTANPYLEPTPTPLPTPTREHPTPPLTSFHWRNVETTNYSEYVANLRAIGCPEQTIRDIVIADVNKLFAARRAELITGGKVPPYWQAAESPPPSVGDQLQPQLLGMDREKTVLIRDLLGVDLATELRKSREGVTYPDNRQGFLSPEKQDQVAAVREAMNENWALLQSPEKLAGMTPDEISAELRQLNEARLAKLAQILTPEELREHELQTSWTAINLRNQLATFQPSATEFAAIHDLQKAFDDEFVHYSGNRTDAATLQRKEFAQQQLEAQIRSQLGEQRYADYLAAKAGNGR